ncbi:MAG: hypothetical protein K2P39_00080, partial [Lachnospiraceae bacterium]|nr:hypothetical protein [Lachnospiraceae bacterium]
PTPAPFFSTADAAKRDPSTSSGLGDFYKTQTWDDPVPDRGPNAPIRYTYYLVEDPTFGGTHVPEE